MHGKPLSEQRRSVIFCSSQTPRSSPLFIIWGADSLLSLEILYNMSSALDHSFLSLQPFILIPLPQYYPHPFCLSPSPAPFYFLDVIGGAKNSQPAVLMGKGSRKRFGEWGVKERQGGGGGWLICILSEYPGSIAKVQQGVFWQGSSDVMRCVISQQGPASLPLTPPN